MCRQGQAGRSRRSECTKSYVSGDVVPGANMISVGSKIPSVGIKLISSEGTVDADAAEILGTGRVVLFTVPGAFTPVCHTNHLPGFAAVAHKMFALGVDKIFCATLNDHHVVKRWAEESGTLDRISFISDGPGALARALGLVVNYSDLGDRYARAAMILEDGVATHVSVESERGVVTGSGAPAIIEALGRKVSAGSVQE